MTDFDEMTGEYTKADSSVNGKRTEEVIKIQREKEKHLHPLKIDRITTIYVPIEKCNEEYRQKWIDARDGKKVDDNKPEKKQPKQSKILVDLDKVKSLIAEGYTLREASKVIGVNTNLLSRRCKEAGIPSPTKKSRIKAFIDKGMNVEEMALRLRVDEKTVKSYIDSL